MDAIRVLIVDDHRVFRQGLIGLIKTRPDLLQVVGEAGSGKEAIREAQRLNPDLILMDLMMPDGDGLDATKVIHEMMPSVKIVMLTASEQDAHLCQAIQAGASGYLTKTMDAEDIFQLILGSIEGQIVMTRFMGTRLLELLSKDVYQSLSRDELLTDRENEVLELVAKGYSNPSIAEALNISLNTAKTHVSHILKKLGLKTRAQVAAYAAQRGLDPSL
jgi:DNA-binding NarL/FixJ family response regulator